jgi:hypothetical protein
MPCLLLPLAPPALAGPCDRAADRAAAHHGVPPALMRAITRAETARDGAPWPWALNIDGQGHWFDSAAAAAEAAEAAVQAGARQIDLGCFQLNLRWHGEDFASLDDMLDPDRNADHAARFLSDLHAEFGDWRAATAAYHSRDDALGAAYVARVEAAHAAAADPAPPPDTRRNGFPLLVTGASGLSGAGGSIVPVPQTRRPIIGAP